MKKGEEFRYIKFTPEDMMCAIKEMYEDYSEKMEDRFRLMEENNLGKELYETLYRN